MSVTSSAGSPSGESAQSSADAHIVDLRWHRSPAIARLTGSPPPAPPAPGRRDIVAHASCEHLQLAGGAQLFHPVQARGVKQAVTGALAPVVGDDERFGDQLGDQREHVGRRPSRIPRSRHRARTRRKHGEPAQQHLLRLGQQLVAPVQRRQRASDAGATRSGVRWSAGWNRSSRRSASSCMPNAATRPAANSMASAIPSSFWQISATSGASPSVRVKPFKPSRRALDEKLHAREGQRLRRGEAGGVGRTFQRAAAGAPVRRPRATVRGSWQGRAPRARLQRRFGGAGCGLDDVLATIQHEQHLALPQVTRPRPALRPRTGRQGRARQQSTSARAAGCRPG